MTDEKTKQRQAARAESVERILDLALDLTVARLENVDPKETRDNIAFDRLARTAQVLFRIADDADALAARKRKEQIENEQNGGGADEAARIARDEAELKRRLDAYIDGLAGQGAPDARSGDGEQGGEGPGDRA
ncbi:MAG: hypothetical protein ACOZAA_15995 [Pseudomonadota bacterium]